jgi:predicted enzyme related to lactoylglutathione lyase
VRVADAQKSAQAAREAGGRVIYEPAPLGTAMVGIVADPTGAPVGIVEMATSPERRQ